MICRVPLNLCPLEININGGLNSNGGLKGEHLEFFSSAIKTLYLQCHNVYGHQTMQSGDLP